MFDKNLILRDGLADMDASEAGVTSLTPDGDGVAAVQIDETPERGLPAVVICKDTPSGTSPTMDIVIQESDDLATGWQDLVTFPQIGETDAPGEHVRRFASTKKYIRHTATLGGTDPNFGKVFIGIGDWEFKNV